MPEESESWKLWILGLDCWREQRLDEAADAFREAIGHAAPDEPALVEYCYALGHVLDELGEAGQAQSALQQALDVALQRRKDNASTEVVIARCFLAEHFIRILRFREAIEATAPSLSTGAAAEGLLFYVRARAFHGLGLLERARQDADRALQLAMSEAQREDFARELQLLIPPAF